MEFKLPLGSFVTYYNPKGGWYPHVLGGWTRVGTGRECIRIYETIEDAEKECPPHCNLRWVELRRIVGREIKKEA